ncbi:MAG: hypothetical protein MUF87_06875 [Anaerolineae bacterium]|jgi:hypothetical protein|nr:hypothetical protein [Anaerolineae bacterium]
MRPIVQETTRNSGTPTRTYALGLLLGAGFGLLTAYLFSRSSEEEARLNGGQRPELQTGQLIGIAVAAIALMRQIAELGKPKKK